MSNKIQSSNIKIWVLDFGLDLTLEIGPAYLQVRRQEFDIIYIIFFIISTNSLLALVFKVWWRFSPIFFNFVSSANNFLI